MDPRELWIYRPLRDPAPFRFLVKVDLNTPPARTSPFGVIMHYPSAPPAMVPLNFWFNESYGLSIPLVALPDEVHINIRLRS